MSEFYLSLAATAQRLIDKYGQTVTFTRTNAGTVNPITGIGTPAVDTTFSGNGIILNYSKALVDGINILSGDNRVLLSGKTEPKNDDIIVAANGGFKVISVKPLTPAGIVVMYEIQVRY